MYGSGSLLRYSGGQAPFHSVRSRQCQERGYLRQSVKGQPAVVQDGDVHPAEVFHHDRCVCACVPDEDDDIPVFLSAFGNKVFDLSACGYLVFYSCTNYTICPQRGQLKTHTPATPHFAKSCGIAPSYCALTFNRIPSLTLSRNVAESPGIEPMRLRALMITRSTLASPLDV